MKEIKVKVLTQTGAEAGEVKLSQDVFGVEPHDQSVFDAVLVARANSRQGTAKTKKRDEVSGGGKKPWRQKGTGRARTGSTRAPQWRHGGIIFGPDGNENYTLKMNKKNRALALKSVLSSKLNDKELVVVDKFSFAAPKTKEFLDCLKKLNAKGKVLLVVGDDSFDEKAMLSAFNVPTVAMVYCDQLSAYDLLNCNTAVFTKEAIECVEEVLLDGGK
ncbi:MAG: 50S ribosomal protein L4 [Bacilli bacterium]|jgi:large subunit ribosomal protein L4|nr:50S ribosomal protein L4 [Bacilli bacterium]MDD3422166.1 50S ribosomal protein L4 [Bacilli bacterium]MDD4065874.1 50S ribosomal protein L4 [Bacilli bacterium]